MWGKCSKRFGIFSLCAAGSGVGPLYPKKQKEVTGDGRELVSVDGMYLGAIRKGVGQ
jgi:hypothetical protein